MIRVAVGRKGIRACRRIAACHLISDGIGRLGNCLPHSGGNYRQSAVREVRVREDRVDGVVVELIRRNFNRAALLCDAPANKGVAVGCRLLRADSYGGA